MSHSLIRQLDKLYRRGPLLRYLDPGTRPTRFSTSARKYKNVSINLEGKSHSFSSLLLRDLCRCNKCLDPSTKQKLFSTADISPAISASSIGYNGSTVQLTWHQDLDYQGQQHVTEIPVTALQQLVTAGSSRDHDVLPRRVSWDKATFERDIKDMDYRAYMEDDAALHQALQILHTHGLVFLTDVPESEKSVSTIGERIGPLKNTFYGYTWDVRSVPQAKNVAYTSQDLGFHMDLLYMYQPPHLQLLHCIRSSSVGGASLFTDSFKALADLQVEDKNAFEDLAELDVHFHYDHAPSHYYRQVRQVVEQPRKLRRSGDRSTSDLTNVSDAIEAVSWAPPFQAPFAIDPSSGGTNSLDSSHPESWLSQETDRWHAAARKFNEKIHRPSGIYTRTMRPGECVIFDNRRVLHARSAFEVADMGKERWLRGAYLDKDPYQSMMRILQQKYGHLNST